MKIILCLFILSVLKVEAQTVMTIADLQMPGSFGPDSASTCGQLVTVEGIASTSSEHFYSGSHSSFYLTDENGGDYGGVLVYHPDPNVFDVYVGDHMTVTGVVSEYYTNSNGVYSNMTWIVPENPDVDVNIINFEQPLPDPVYVDMWYLDPIRQDDHVGEIYEGMLVEIEDAVVVDNSAPPSWRQFTVADPDGNQTVIRTAAYTLGDYGRPPLGASFELIRGVIYQVYGNYNIMPRSIDDIESEDPCANPIEIAIGELHIGSTIGESSIVGGQFGDKFHVVDIESDGVYEVSLCHELTDFDTYLSVWSDCPFFGNSVIAENDDYCGTNSRISLQLDVGTYWVVVDSYTGEGHYAISVINEPEPDDPAFLETFDAQGSVPSDWTIESQSRSTPWTPVQESGEDWAMESSHTAFQQPFDEWLKSPVYDLTWWENIEAGFTNSYVHANSEAAFRVSTNGGLSWSTVQAWTASVDEGTLLDVSNWVDGESNVRFAFRFRSDFITDGPSWRIDDFFLNGTPKAPVASTPVPEQPPVVWSSGTGTIGCTWTQPLEVAGDSLQVRIDYNGDGDYQDGGEEAWVDLPVQADAASIDVTHLATFGNNGLLKFEFRAKSVGGAWGYSGTAGIEGITDDWFVLINAELEPPAFANYTPTGQPDPDWLPDLTTSVGVQITDNASVDASTIQMRVDTNADGAFTEPGETWQNLSGYTNSTMVDVLEEVTFAGDGEYLAQFQAADLTGNQAESDTLRIRIDSTPPTQSFLALTGSGNTSLNLAFSATTDANFQRYELAVSTDSLVDENDLLWSDTQDPALGSISTNQTTVTGLQPAMRYWVALRAYDLAGNASTWSNSVSGITEGAPPLAVVDLTATKTAEGVVLSWTPPVEDIYGGSPVVIQDYDVHASEDPHFVPNQDTFLGSTTSPSYLIPLSRTSNVLVFYRVVVNGAGPGTPAVPMILVPAGTFVMGQEGTNGVPEHQVTLTHDYFLGTNEVTNLEFLVALQWAFDSGFVLYADSTIWAYGFELLDMDNPDCEISFEDGMFSLRESQSSYAQSAYPAGYDPANHPVLLVSWYGAACFCDWRSMIEAREPFYNGIWIQNAEHNPYLAEGYRLPTEAEWEYAARYNDGRVYPWGGAEPDCNYANINMCIGWTAPVGSFPQGGSSLGLMDMAGSVYEWCGDRYAAYPDFPVINPLGGGGEAMKRSHMWDEVLYMANRSGGSAQYMGQGLGFRICRTAD